MERSSSCFFLFLVMGLMKVRCSADHHHHLENGSSTNSWTSNPRKLLVFGDSYADTGNLPKIVAPSWRKPYGVTFPRKPSGRFSDGRVFTDFLAKFLKINSPIPYKYRRYGYKVLQYGMNFAIGGSGVFDTVFLSANLTTQINNFKKQVEQGAIDLRSSTALVAVSGNDYVHYQDNGGTMEGLKTFTPKVIDQLKKNLECLRDLGVETVAVTNLHPVGCLPSFTRSSSYKKCNTSANDAVVYHNNLLEAAIDELNRDNKNGPAIAIVDLFNGFMSVLNKGGNKFGDILRPCCEAMTSNFHCGFADSDGMEKYTLCRRPDSTFYWDSSHPTQAGWKAVFSSLKPTLNNLLN